MYYQGHSLLQLKREPVQVNVEKVGNIILRFTWDMQALLSCYHKGIVLGMVLTSFGKRSAAKITR
jgi:hypothetical protein